MQATQKGPKACTTCAKAKARCIPRAGGGGKCERCHRLKKDCFSRPPAPPRVKKIPKRSRVAQVEKRLNELSAQFGGAQPGANRMLVFSATSSQSNSASTITGTTKPTASSSSTVDSKAATGHILNFEHFFPSPSPTGDEGNEASAWSPEATKLFDSVWPLPAESELLLMAYREMFAHLFPFVLIPKELSSVDLRIQRPFLWKAVMVSACIFDATRQVNMGEELLQDIGKATMVDGARSLDVLQAVEMVIVWWHFGLKSSQVTNLLFLARSMCVNLSSMSYRSQGDDVKYGPLDHLRALAGIYYINTVVFTTNKKPDVLMNKNQLEDCFKVIESSMEFASDEYLVKLVKIQQLAQTISMTMAPEGGMAHMSLPLVMMVQSYQDQLDTFRASLLPQFADNPTLNLHISVAATLLTDIAISGQRCSPENMRMSDRLQLLWSCVRSVRDFFQVRFGAPELERPRFLILAASDVTYTLITALKLVALKLPEWEMKAVLKELPILTILGQQIDHLSPIIEKRKSGLLSPGRCDAEDPLERLFRLLKTTQEVVSMSLASNLPMSIVSEIPNNAWQDLHTDSWGGVDDDQGQSLMDMTELKGGTGVPIF